MKQTRAELERLDQELAKGEQEYVDNEKEKQMIEKKIAEVKEHFETTGKYVKLLQLENVKLSFTLGIAKDKHQRSLLVQVEEQTQDLEKEVADLEEKIAILTTRIKQAKLELQSAKDSMDVLTRSFSELSTRQKSLQDRKCELLATLWQYEEALNGCMLGGPSITPSSDMKMVL